MNETQEKLALEGGPKTIEEPLPVAGFGADVIGEEEERNVLQVLRSRTMSRIGHPLADSYAYKLELAIQQRFDVPHAVVVNSCASALQVALVALGIGPGDEVIVPSIGWICCATAAINIGAVPVPVEFDESLTPDPDDIEKKIGPQTRAIMVVHFRGQPTNMDRVMALARKHDLKVVEDVAQAFGGKYKGRYLGTIGDVGCYSFNMHKVITSGEGGAVVMKDVKLYGRALAYSGMYPMILQNRTPGIGDIDVPMMNLRMPELCAAVAYAQFGKLDSLLSTLRSRKQEVLAGLRGVQGLKWAPMHDSDGDCAYTLPLLFDDAEQAQFFLDAMRAEGANNMSGLKTGFSGGEVRGTFNLMTSEGLDPLLQRRLALAESWRCVIERYGPTEKLNPWKLLGAEPTPLPEGIIPLTQKRLARVVAIKINPQMQARHMEQVVRAATKVAKALMLRFPQRA
jgi:dTDP-4-amino-4,6-dideoxygalactose transaminase